MNKTELFRVDSLRFWAAAGTSLISFILGITLIIIERYGSALLFFVIFLLFLPIIRIYGAAVTVDEEGIRSSFLGKPLLQMKWDEIQEIGVAGSKLFNNRNGKKTGTVYIYISRQTMTEDERFNMMLKFPPKDKIYFEYSKEAVLAVQMRWSSKIQTYNSGDIRI